MHCQPQVLVRGEGTLSEQQACKHAHRHQPVHMKEREKDWKMTEADEGEAGQKRNTTLFSGSGLKRLANE